MRIKIYGGPLSISYNLAKFLRRANMDVTFYTDKAPLDESYTPDWEDEEMKGVSCDWIKKIDINLKNCIVKRKKERRFLAELRDADILHMYGEASIWASLTKIPYVYSTYGYDIDQMPFRRGTLKSLTLAHLLRRSISKSSCVLLAPHERNVIKEKLNLNVRSEYIPCPIDTDKYKNRDNGLMGELKQKGGYDFIFFSPTRHEWTHPDKKNNKANDKIINAFSRFINSSGKRALLVLVEKGDDLGKSKALVRLRELGNHVMWIKPQKKERLIEFYSASDIVFDQFAVPGFGQTFLEAMSCGVPTFNMYLEGYEELYSEQPPYVNVSTEEEMFEKLTALTSRADRLRDIGRRSREWILKYHDWRVAVGRYRSLYEDILG